MGASRLRLAIVGCLVATAGMAACGETPTSPATPGTARNTFAPLDVRCWLEAELLCSVHRFGEGDLTARAEWYATELIWGTTADPAVTFPRPGVPVASRPVKLYIAARVGTETRASSLAYDMAPGARPIALAALVGFSYEGDTGFTVLEGVRVDLLDGDGTAGLSAVTGGGGFYTISHVRVGVPFTIRASKAGYLPVNVQHPGIRVLPEGFPDTASIAQHFRLIKRP